MYLKTPVSQIGKLDLGQLSISYIKVLIEVSQNPSVPVWKA